MDGFGRTIGACLAAAMTAATVGGLSLPLIVFLGALFTGHSTFDKPLAEEINGISSGIVLWSIVSLLMGFLPALLSAVFGILPAHLVLRRLGRDGRLWYAGVGLVAGILSILILRHALEYLEFFADAEGMVPLLIAAGVGGPPGALVFRRVLRPLPAPTTAKNQLFG